VQVRCLGLRPRDLKGLFERCGFEANRILRTRFGPVAMDRALARGRSRPLTDGELRALHDAAGIEGEAPARPSKRRRR
jgi:16S rRNA U516 pseudouridylate synthase RsuA-like enzyme